ncbi:MAG: RecX family transcriptional regulator [Alphaproteobacteria bacterium]|nr:RecX family transcriptional regulator [Alphaproteobacteria bacterium]
MNIKTQNTSAPKQKKRTPRPPKKITPTYLHNAGLYYLQRFAASSAHFREVMMRKVKKSCHYHKDQNYEDCAQMVDALVEQFASSGLLDDSAYTRGVVTSLRRSGKSRRAIIAKLKQKGLSDDMIERTLTAYDDDSAGSSADAELTAALNFARKKRLGPFTRDKETPPEKALASMARAGFSYDVCKTVLEMEPKAAQARLTHRYF